MRHPANNTAGKQDGGTSAAVRPSCLRIPAHQLKSFPDLPGRHRLRVVYFDAPGPVLPNGLPRPQLVMAACAFRLAGGFHGLARVERSDAGPVLSVETNSYDLLLDRPVSMPFSLSLLRTLYSEIGRQFVRGQARQSARKARN